jgi:hypothetical protein
MEHRDGRVDREYRAGRESEDRYGVFDTPAPPTEASLASRIARWKRVVFWHVSEYG